MKVLHYVDNLKHSDLRSDSIQTLIDAERNYAETYLAKNFDDFQKLSNDVHPDIIHLHACWDHQAYRCAKFATKKNIPIALSTHWSLNSFARKNEQHVEKVIKSIAYFSQLVKLVDAFVLDDEKEKKAILKQGWSNRIDIIASSILNSAISTDSMATSMITFYKKVLNTGYQFSMSAQEYEAMISLMTAGIDQTTNHNPLPSNQLLNLRSLNPNQWRHIFLYADDEGVRDIIDKSIQYLQLYAPNINTTEIVRYPLFLQKNLQSLDEYRDKTGKKLAKKLFADEDIPCEYILKDIVIAFYHTKQLYDKGTLSLLHLCNLHTLIKYNDYDEDQLKDILKRMQLYKFSRRMIKILEEFTQLEEGFMPLIPLNDKHTKQIRNIFNKRK